MSREVEELVEVWLGCWVKGRRLVVSVGEGGRWRPSSRWTVDWSCRGWVELLLLRGFCAEASVFREVFPFCCWFW